MKQDSSPASEAQCCQRRTLKAPKPQLRSPTLEPSVFDPHSRVCRRVSFLGVVVYTAQWNTLCPRQTHAREKASVEA